MAVEPVRERGLVCKVGRSDQFFGFISRNMKPDLFFRYAEYPSDNPEINDLVEFYETQGLHGKTQAMGIRMITKASQNPNVIRHPMRSSGRGHNMRPMGMGMGGRGRGRGRGGARMGMGGGRPHFNNPPPPPPPPRPTQGASGGVGSGGGRPPPLTESKPTLGVNKRVTDVDREQLYIPVFPLDGEHLKDPKLFY